MNILVLAIVIVALVFLVCRKERKDSSMRSFLVGLLLFYLGYCFCLFMLSNFRQKQPQRVTSSPGKCMSCRKFIGPENDIISYGELIRTLSCHANCDR